MKISLLSLAPRESVMAATGFILSTSMAWASPTLRPFTVDDIFRLEQIATRTDRSSMFSPDGEYLAVGFEGSNLNNVIRRGDIWVQRTGSESFNVSRNEKNGSRSYNPVWSPDSTKVAFLSIRNGEQSLWMWNTRTGGLIQLSKRASYGSGHAYEWVDDQHLIYVVGETTKAVTLKDQIDRALVVSKSWERALRGDSTTASIVQSDPSAIPSAAQSDDGGEVLLLSLDGLQKTLTRGMIQHWKFSHESQKLAVVKKARTQGTSGNPDLDAVDIEIITLSGHTRAKTRIGYLNTMSLRWREKGRVLAFLGFPRANPQRTDLLSYRLDDNGELTSDKITGLAYYGFSLFAPNGDMLIRATAAEAASSKESQRVDWWRIGANGKNTLLTKQFKKPPVMLMEDVNQQTVLCVADGEVWRINVEDGSGNKLTNKFTPEVIAATWSPIEWFGVRSRQGSKLFVKAREGSGTAYYMMDMNGVSLQPLLKPSPAAELVDYSHASKTALFLQHDESGLFLWRKSTTQPAQLVMQGNVFLREIAPSRWRSFQYTSLSGTTLTGWILLPYSYEPGKRYPLLSIIYPGFSFNASTPPDSLITDHDQNPRIMSDHGYAVLIPSMREMTDFGTKDRDALLASLPKDTLPAVKKCIEMGIADPNRLLLYGVSAGGFSATGLYVQGEDYKMVVSRAGGTNLPAQHGTFAGTLRYAEPQTLLNDRRNWGDLGWQYGLRSSPAQDEEHYLGNSSLLYPVKKTNTQLALIFGDLDSIVPMQQSEEFFRRQLEEGNKTPFLRMWGEHHAITSPANAKAMIQFMFDFFDGY